MPSSSFFARIKRYNPCTLIYLRYFIRGILFESYSFSADRRSSSFLLADSKPGFLAVFWPCSGGSVSNRPALRTDLRILIREKYSDSYYFIKDSKKFKKNFNILLILMIHYLLYLRTYFFQLPQNFAGRVRIQIRN